MINEWVCTFCGKPSYHRVVEGDEEVFRCNECLNEYLGFKDIILWGGEDGEG